MILAILCVTISWLDAEVSWSEAACSEDPSASDWL
jgi:hypothetical protein